MSASSYECEMINANLLNSRSGICSNGCSVMPFDKCVVTSYECDIYESRLAEAETLTLLRRIRLERDKYIPLYSKSTPGRGICSRHRKYRGFPATQVPRTYFPQIHYPTNRRERRALPMRGVELAAQSRTSSSKSLKIISRKFTGTSGLLTITEIPRMFNVAGI